MPASHLKTCLDIAAKARCRYTCIINGVTESMHPLSKVGLEKKEPSKGSFIFASRNKHSFLWKETIKGGVYDETGRKTVCDADMAT